VGTIKVKGNIGTATGKPFFPLGVFFESRAKPPFAVQLRRKGFAQALDYSVFICSTILLSTQTRRRFIL
jgi:hypothetical protein